MARRTLIKASAGVAAGVLLLFSVPLAGAQTTITDLEVTVVDDAEEISAEDEQWLITDTPGIDFPDAVRSVRYITFGENSSNLNNDIEELLRAEYPEWIQEDSFAPGELIIAVGFDPNQVGTYAGNDVAAATGLAEQDRLDAINDSMKPLLQDGRTALAMFEGSQSVADPTVINEPTETNWWLVGGIVGGIAALGAGAVGVGAAASRKNKARKARENFDYAQKHYGETAQQLDGINIRAHSLTSPLADDELRRQWDDVNTRFLEVNDTFGTFGDLSAASEDKAFLAHAAALETARTTVTQMETAQKNIDTLYDMEHGDEGVRRRELTRLREDIQEARLEINDKDSVLDDTLQELINRIEGMSTASPTFMDEYARVIRDYAAALTGVEKHMEEVERTEHSTPAIYDNDWRVGTGYNSFVPFYMISTWHAADVSAASAASSAGSSNTSFSSGFSGAGGSSGW